MKADNTIPHDLFLMEGVSFRKDIDLPIRGRGGRELHYIKIGNTVICSEKAYAMAEALGLIPDKTGI